jgi:MinD-like ATPase involved in chromosome partitioning or flagellar assembly
MSLGIQNTATSKRITSYNLVSVSHKYNRINYDNSSDRSVIITILSNKGGVGKTSFAIVSAIFISQKMKKKTLLLELDSSPGDLGVLFDIEKNKSLELAIRFPEKYKEFVKSIHKNLYALKGISSPLVAENIKKGSINKLVNFISSDYDYIIVDTQTIINGPILDALKLSSEIFLISDYSFASIARISSLVDLVVKKFSIQESKVKIVINKKKFADFFKIIDLTKIIKVPIYAFINFDKGFSKNKLMFNKTNILRSKFFKQVSRIILTVDEELRNNAKR